VSPSDVELTRHAPELTGGQNEASDESTGGSTGAHCADGPNVDDAVEPRLQNLFRALVARIHAKLGPKRSPELVEMIAKQIFDELRRPNCLTWEASESITVAQAQRRSNVGKVVRIAGYVAELHAPQAVAFPGANGSTYEIDATCARITDLHGSTMWSLDIIGEDLIDRVRNSVGTTTEFLGIVVAVPSDLDLKRPDRVLGIARRDFLLHVVDVRGSHSAFDLLGASAQERVTARTKVDALLAEGVSPFDYLKSLAIKSTGIVGLDQLPLLDAALDLVLLQSVSGGSVGNAPGKLHMLLIGPPARGKKLLGLVARGLNPVCVELSSAKTSSAGLVGASIQTASGWVSQPGALPQASKGVAWVQDAHFWSQLTLAKVGPVLMEVIEDGCVRDTVAGGKKRTAETALVIDMNRQAQSLQGATGEAALLKLVPLLSRIDVILEIPRDDALAWETACQLVANGSSPEGSREWEREASLLVAALRDRTPEVDLEPIRKPMSDILRQVGTALMESGVADSGDFAARLAVSFQRLAIASARIEGRKVATREDASRAVRLLQRKIAFLRTYRVRLSVCPIDQWLQRFGGREVSPGDLADLYHEEFDRQVNQRTMRRYVQASGAKEVRRGVYRMPGDPTDEGG